jgi:hypothetical protein
MLLLLEIVAAMFVSRVLYGIYRKWSDAKGYSLLKPMLTVASVIGVIVLIYFAILSAFVYKWESAEAKRPCHVGYEICMPGQPRVNTPPEGLTLDMSKSVPIKPPMPAGFIPVH